MFQQNTGDRLRSNHFSTFRDSLTTADIDDRPMSVVGLNVKNSSEAVISVVLGDDVNRKDSQSHGDSNRGEYVKLLGLIYAILLIIIGFLLSLVEGISHKWLGTAPNAAFLTYILVVGTLFLLFLQFYLLRHHTEEPQQTENSNSRMSRIKKALSSAFDRFRRPSQRAENSTAIRELAAQTGCTNMAIENSEQSDVNNNSISNPPRPRTVTFNIRQQADVQRPSEMFDSRRRGSMSSVNSARHLASFGRAMRPRPASEMEFDEDGEGDDGETFWMDLDKLGNLFSHQGSNFFLRIGALMFGLGHVIYVCLEIENWIHPEDCLALHYVYGWVFVLRLVFIVTQTFVLFKGTNVKITKHQSVALLGFMHLIATNLTLWLCTLIREVSEVLYMFDNRAASPTVDSTTQHPGASDSTAYYIYNNTDRHRRAAALAGSDTSASANSTSQSDSCLNNSLVKISRYLFPFVLEYSLIALGAIAFILYSGIGSARVNDGHEQVARGFKNLIRVFGDSVYLDKKKTDHATENGHNVDQDNIETNSSQVAGHPATDVEGGHGSGAHSESVLAKSHSGLFVGVLLLAAILTCVVLFYFGIAVTDFTRSAQIYFITDIVLHSSLLVGCCLALFLTRNLGYVPRPLSTDDGLLFLTMSGSLLYELSVVVTSANHVPTSSSQLVALDLSAAIIASTQTVIQTVLILYAMRLCPATANDVINMPGRGTLSFLIIGNIAAWIQRTMQVKELDSLERTDLYGSVAWLLLVNINLPLLLFYRFHSSVSFADAWHVAYTPLYHDVMASASSGRAAAHKMLMPSSPLALSLPPSRSQLPMRRFVEESDRSSSEGSVVVIPTRISTSAPGSPRGRRRSTVSAVWPVEHGENYHMHNQDFSAQLAEALSRESDHPTSNGRGDSNV